MKTFKINLNNYNIDKPELEFGCFTDKQIRLMIALVESHLREIKDHIANVDQQIEDINAKLISLKKSYEENSYLYDFSQERQLKKGKKSLQGTRIEFTLNKDQTVNDKLCEVRKAFDQFNLISGLHSFLSLTDKQFLNILPTCSLLSKQDEKTLIDKLKDLDFLGKDFKAA